MLLRGKTASAMRSTSRISFTEGRTRDGRSYLGRRKINSSITFAGQTVGVRPAEVQIWQASFLKYDQRYFDNERGRVPSGPSPFVPDSVSGVDHLKMARPERLFACFAGSRLKRAARALCSLRVCRLRVASLESNSRPVQ